MSTLTVVWISILCVGFVRGQAVTSIAYSSLACQGDSMDLICPKGFFIRIDSAFWGRADSSTCAVDGNDNDVRCSDPDTQYLLSAKCEGKESCTVKAGIGYFGDCLYKTVKYLQVEFTCEKRIIDALICEDSGKLTIGCPNDEKIQVVQAFFGREDSNITCSRGMTMEHDRCSAITATKIFKELCDGKKDCDVEARVDIFGDPCPGSFKYLRLKYTCAGCFNQHGDDEDCEYWFLLGECSKNPSWMTANCRKACWKCDSQEPVCHNKEGDKECQRLAEEGECTSNPSWMMAFCKKACLQCDKNTACVDKYQPPDTSSGTCADFKADAQCTDNPNWMLPMCTKSCFECDEHIKCENKHSNTTQCELWALEGQCNTNPGWMIPFCLKSCLGCESDPVCANKSPDFSCDYWSFQGECENNPVWMLTNCWKACINCDGPKEPTNLANNDLECDQYAFDGECKNNPSYMMTSCQKACSWSNKHPVTDCVNKEGNDTACNIWFGDGECVENPSWMYARCSRACRRCDQTGYKATYIGRKPLPGDTIVITRSNTIVPPEEFPVNAKLTHISGYFKSTQPVYLQVWRPLNGNAEKMDKIYETSFKPSQANIVETVAVDRCVMVSKGDRLGFTSIDGVAPIANNFDKNNILRPTAFRDAGSSRDFDQLGLPFAFSISAGYDEFASC